MLNTTNLQTWEGCDLVGNDDDKIGTIDEIYLDDDTGQPEFALVKSGLFGQSRHFVPLRDASQAGDELRVPYSKDQVKDAPALDADGSLSQEEEARLYSYYGLDYSERRSDSGVGEDERDDVVDAAGRGRQGADDAMTRSEEELRVGTRTEERGRVRLRKYVTTENVTQTVPVKKEKVRVEREPITDANRDQAVDGPEITENVHEEVVYEEEPVVEKRVVPKERVRLEKDVETTDEQVSEDLRKEEIEVDDPDRRA